MKFGIENTLILEERYRLLFNAITGLHESEDAEQKLVIIKLKSMSCISRSFKGTKSGVETQRTQSCLKKKKNNLSLDVWKEII